MSTHYRNLKRHLPLLDKSRILDVGCGRGKFLVEAAVSGAKATGIEIYQPYISMTKERLQKAGAEAEIFEGSAEELPFGDKLFDFVNLSEVLEHVEDPLETLKGIRRVMTDDGSCYLSSPNRFGLKDQHFHLWFLNWLPRVWGERYISLAGKHKDYSLKNGRQRLGEMHYYSYRQLKNLLDSVGFRYYDLREKKLADKGWWGKLLRPLYVLLREFYFDSFHLLAVKDQAK